MSEQTEKKINQVNVSYEKLQSFVDGINKAINTPRLRESLNPRILRQMLADFKIVYEECKGANAYFVEVDDLLRAEISPKLTLIRKREAQGEEMISKENITHEVQKFFDRAIKADLDKLNRSLTSLEDQICKISDTAVANFNGVRMIEKTFIKALKDQGVDYTLPSELQEDLVLDSNPEITNSDSTQPQGEQASPRTEGDQASPVTETDQTSSVTEDYQASTVGESDQTSPVTEGYQASPVTETDQTVLGSESYQASTVTETTPEASQSTTADSTEFSTTQTAEQFSFVGQETSSEVSDQVSQENTATATVEPSYEQSQSQTAYQTEQATIDSPTADQTVDGALDTQTSSTSQVASENDSNPDAQTNSSNQTN